MIPAISFESLAWPRPAALRFLGRTAQVRTPIEFDTRSTFGDSAGLAAIEAALRARWDRERAERGFAPESRAAAGSPLVLIDDGQERPRGAYELTVDWDSTRHSPALRLAASELDGVWNGLQTFSQWLACADHSVDLASGPALSIVDRPDFPVRGVMLDISRTRVPTLTTLLELVDWLAALKINQLQLYMEHTFAYRDHEAVWRAASPLTAEDVRVLDAACRARRIDLVPNQQSFGHMHRWLIHDRYRDMAEVPEGVEHAFSIHKEPFALCPLDARVLPFLESLFDELLPNFSSRLFNVGCDETFDLGRGRSRDACAERGTERVYLEFLRAIEARVRTRGKRMQFWGDIIVQKPELLGELPRDAVALEWGYEEGHPFAEHARAFRASGLEYHVCPGTSSWQSFAGRTTNVLANLRAAAIHGHENGAGGYLITDWGDRGHHQPLEVSRLGFLMGAGHAWNVGSAREDIGREQIASLLDTHAFRDAGCALGTVALELGDTYRHAGARSTNGSALFFQVAFAREPWPPKRVVEPSRAGFEYAREHVERVARGISSARSLRADANLLESEWRWLASVLVFSCDFGIARSETGLGADVRAIAQPTRTALSLRLRTLVDEHRRLWLARYRPGGLDESCAWFERLDDLLRA